VDTGSRKENASKTKRAFSSRACPALDAGWVPVRVKKTRQKQKRTTRGKPARKKAGAIVSRRLVV
jgi:hypothetical protein